MHADKIRLQAALDFMVSYGVAILVIAIAVYTIFQLGIFNPILTPTYCTAAPNFACSAYAINRTGGLTIILSQATGGTMNIIAAACSSSSNSVGNGPAYGNIKLQPQAGAPQFYPNQQLQNGLLLYTSNSTVLTMYCYNNFGIATSQLGNSFTGFVWLNYQYMNLPQGYNSIQRVVTFTAKYS